MALSHVRGKYCRSGLILEQTTLDPTTHDQSQRWLWSWAVRSRKVCSKIGIFQYCTIALQKLHYTFMFLKKNLTNIVESALKYTYSNLLNWVWIFFYGIRKILINKISTLLLEKGVGIASFNYGNCSRRFIENGVYESIFHIKIYQIAEFHYQTYNVPLSYSIK